VDIERLLTIRFSMYGVQDHAIGYPNLAVFKNSSDDFALYRRFGYLQSRLLLDKQDDLRILERRLEEYDRANVSDSHTRALDDSVILPRTALLVEIECAFNAYGILQPEPRFQYMCVADER
jgi:hypothetical protein